ncbi:hypothetical protein RHSIM_Rhsim12G0041200 [Rhododendron simsii]|uniref:Uncharacterized protein n=1 Tax=Rhododendron simsii TaxID=118357 RepID=A0A834G4D9_RHOSS|nr:hypothetical protein RHSIM_Rhsim12G0041200 [Rhododendron simsii]
MINWVADVILQGGKWDRQKISLVVMQEELEAITSIPLLVEKTNDILYGISLRIESIQSNLGIMLRMRARAFELGLEALHGQKGPAYDQIILNAGMVDHMLGCDGAQDVSLAMDRAREAIDSGKALTKLLNYINISHKVK